MTKEIMQMELFDDVESVNGYLKSIPLENVLEVKFQGDTIALFYKEQMEVEL